MSPRTYGWRFIEEFQRAGGSTSAWPPAALDALRKADRRTFIDALGRVAGPVAKSLLVAAHTAEPEALARRAVKAAKEGNAGQPSDEGDASWLAFLAMIARGPQ